MKIAYAINGEGFGHAARLLTLAPGLARWHDLTLGLPNTVRARIQAELPQLPTLTIPNFFLVKKADRILYFRTIVRNLPLVFASLATVIRLARFLRRHRFDGVLSDFEPFMAWAGKLAGLRVVQLNHPSIIRRFVEPSVESVSASIVAALMEGPSDQRLLCSFYHGDIGPLLRGDLLKVKPTKGDYLLINVKTGYQEEVRRVLDELRETMPDLRWEVFPRPGADFAKALAGCRAVISAAGHQMLSEALVLGKPVLALPQAGQFEQKVNARMLEASGRGMAGSLSRLAQLIPQFVSNLPRFEQAFTSKAALQFNFRESTDQALEKIGLAFADQTPAVKPVLVWPNPQAQRKRA